MIVTVTAESVELTDADDLKSLHVLCDPALSFATVDIVLRRTNMGYVDDDYAYLNIDALRRQRESRACDNDTAFDKMLEYAMKKAWISPDSSAVRAHIVRTETT